MEYIAHLVLIVGIFIILASSLNLINGMCGQFSLGHAGFWGVGAYSSAIYSVYYPLALAPIPNLIVASVVAFIASAFCGLLIGVPCLRLRGDYLAIATLGFSEILRIIIQNTELVGGPRGFINIPKWTNLPIVYIFVVLTLIVLANIKRSTHGRAIISIREDEIAAETMGINIFKYKLLAFTLGAGIAGVAGALFAHAEQFLHPNNFSFMWSVVILLMIILGGLGSFTGAVIAAILVTIFPELLRFFGENISQLRMTIYSLGLILLMLSRPEGIFGKHEIDFTKWFGRKA